MAHDDEQKSAEGDDWDLRDESMPKWGETLKKLVSAGLGAAFMTEEHIRAYLGEVKLPKDVLTMVLQGANKSKEDLLNRIGTETMRLISKIDFVKEASRFVEEHKFKVTAEIEVLKKDKPKSKEP